MTSDDAGEIAEIEARVRAAASETAEIPSYRPKIGELMKLFGVGRSTVQDWYDHGVRIGTAEFTLRYWRTGGNFRLAHPADVLAILEATRRIRSRHDPDGAGICCPTCGQPLPTSGN